MRTNIVLQVKDVSMSYRLFNEKLTSFKQYVIKQIRGQVKYQYFDALRNISFEVERGEVFGIVGLNGAGKSTLLKIISGILKPSSGEIIRQGNVAPLIELGAGFNGDLTGVENIYLNGLLLGQSRKQVSSKLDEIIAFSELDEFIHMPLKNYSSGMKARLGFSIATATKPQILIVDEVLSVGDFKFKEKSENKIRSMINEGTTVLFVSHSSDQIKKLCNRVLWLERGMVKEVGDVNAVLEHFKNAK